MKYGPYAPSHQVSSNSDKNCQKPRESCPRILDGGPLYEIDIFLLNVNLKSNIWHSAKERVEVKGKDINSL